MDVPFAEQVETLTHEGSHHKTAYTDDMCLIGSIATQDCVYAYGRKDCELLAKLQPKSAQHNADNFCFFINDAASENVALPPIPKQPLSTERPNTAARGAVGCCTAAITAVVTLTAFQMQG
mmetsp:Transcript_24715/g.77748  ORF Transcript_24715/g.77748 Transcript_24715/m.77748 type:complete len:121 (+) Transcript_24715:1092-1454(+)